MRAQNVVFWFFVQPNPCILRTLEDNTNRPGSSILPIILKTSSPHFSESSILFLHPRHSTKIIKKALTVDANIVDPVIELALFRHLAQNRTWTKTRNFSARRSSKKERNKSSTFFFSLRIWRWLHQDWIRMKTLKSCHEHSFTPSYWLFSWKCFPENVWRSWALNGLWVFLWWLYSCQDVGLKTTTINPMLHPSHRFPVKRSQSFVLGVLEEARIESQDI